MIRFSKILFYLFLTLSLSEITFSKENFFNEGVKLFKKKIMMMLNFYLKEA